MSGDIKNEIQKLKNKSRLQELKYKKMKDSFISLKKTHVEAEKTFKELYDFNPTIIITINRNFIIKKLNYRAAVFFGSERTLLINKSFLNFIRSSSKLLFKEKISNLLNNQINQTLNLNLINLKKESIHATVTCRVNSDNLIQLYLFNLSREPQKIFNYEIERSFTLINKLFEGTNEALAALDSEFNLKIINESFTYLFSKIIAKKISVGINLVQSLSEFPKLQSKIFNACTKALKGEKALEIIENSFTKVNNFFALSLPSIPI